MPSLPTLIVAGILILALVLAVLRIRKRGMCDCGGDCSGKVAGTCDSCSVADHMVDDMLSAAKLSSPKDETDQPQSLQKN